MIVYFIRHGQTDWNKALRWQGRSDIELNSLGHAQASAIKEYFVQANIRPVVVLSSPMKRARVTASRIASAFDLEVLVEPAFREIDLGDFEGMTTDELKGKYADEFDHWLSMHHLIASPGGENIDQAIDRMQHTLRSHINTFGDKTVIVAHQAILKAMKAALADTREMKELASFKQANFEIDVWDVEQAQLIERIDIR